MTSQPECKISPDGSKEWWLNGKLHRTDGPAIEHSDGSKAWCVDDHELDPKTAIHDYELQKKYPKLIEAMAIYSVHDS
jgi:hypothetical protein